MNGKVLVGINMVLLEDLYHGLMLRRTGVYNDCRLVEDVYFSTNGVIKRTKRRLKSH
jgi:hypothetical protein